MSKITLSFTALNNVHKFPCSWLNKIMGIEQESNEYMIAGKAAHERIAKIIENKEKLPNDLDFQKAEVHFRKSHNEKYLWHGYADGVNYRSKSLLEVKTVSKNLWTNAQMDKSMQPVYYSWLSGFPNVFLLTCKFDLSSPKVYYRKYTQDDWKRAEKWALEGLKIIETTDWKTYKCDGSCYLKERCFLYDPSINSQNQ